MIYVEVNIDKLFIVVIIIIFILNLFFVIKCFCKSYIIFNIVFGKLFNIF